MLAKVSMMMNRKVALLTAICAVAAIITTVLLSRASMAASTGYFVSPTGNDTQNGLSAGAAFRTIQKAVDLAQPGDVINLAPGTYAQDVISKRNGSSSARITITGPSNAVVKGGGRARVIEINHDNITLNGFTIDGQFGDANSPSGYRDKLLYVLGKQPLDGVSGLRVTGMTLKNAGGECMRLRYFAKQNEVSGSWIGPCGVHDFRFNGGSKNGEGIYIGTAPEQRADGKNPTTDPDLSNNNRIHSNVINTQGNECVDVKEAATGNIIENNNCTGQKDPESGGLDSRGNGNIFRNNNVYGNVGAGVRLGGDTSADGLKNLVYNNTINDNKAGGIKFQRTPQTQICGNSMSNNVGGNAVGTYGSDYVPTTACSGTTTVPAPTATPVPSASPSSAPSPSAAPAPSAPSNTTPVAGELAVTRVLASGHDGNVPQNTVDNNLSTRWSAQGDYQWIWYDFGQQHNVQSVLIAFHRGNERVTSFDIEVSDDATTWKRVYSGRSNGATLDRETFDIPDTNARYVSIVGHGNTVNNWNSLTEVDIVGGAAQVQTTVPAAPAPVEPAPSAAPAPVEAAPAAPAAPAPVEPVPSAAPAPVESAPAAPAAPVAEAPACFGYAVDGNVASFIEAETHMALSGRFEGAADGGRSGGAFMTIPGDGMREDGGTFVSFNLNVTNGGTFQVWLLGHGNDGSADSFYVQVDNGSLVQANVEQDGWGWKDADSSVNLSDGQHTLKIMNREDGSSVDKILLVKSDDYEPNGLGDAALTPCR